MSVFKTLKNADLIQSPDFVGGGLQYETKTGSIAYGVASESSDTDIAGFTIPPKEVVFPHLRGEILDFGRQKQRFAQSVDHHIEFEGEEYDVTIYSIVKFFSFDDG